MNIIDIVCVDLAKCGDRWGAAAFMHATDCNFTIRSYSTDPSAAIRELMRTVQHVQGGGTCFAFMAGKRNYFY